MELVVGSRPSGAACAAALVAQGRRAHMLMRDYAWNPIAKPLSKALTRQPSLGFPNMRRDMPSAQRSARWRTPLAVRSPARQTRGCWPSRATSIRHIQAGWPSRCARRASAIGWKLRRNSTLWRPTWPRELPASFCVTGQGLAVSERLESLLDALPLENLLLASAAIILLGLGGIFYRIVQWGRTGLGNLNYAAFAHILMLSLTGVVAGVQLTFSALLSAVISNRTSR